MSFAARALLRLLRLRYIAVGGAVGGGAYVHQKYEDVRDAMPDFKPYLDRLPDRHQVQKLFAAMNNVNLPTIKFPELKDSVDTIRDKMNKLQAVANTFLHKESTSTKMALDAPKSKQDDDLKDDSIGESLKKRGFSQMLNFAVNADRTEATQEDVMGIQVRYQREIDRLERENRELKRESMMMVKQEAGGKTRRRGVRKPLIDMYSEVLDDLLEFEQMGSQYSMHDHLPRVVVVGDQSSGKTSVLEVIAKARIFPRGSGEMMTRTPVKVTLSEGPYHIAFFKDSPREFDLTREEELGALRKEIEVRMKANIKNGETVSAECIGLTVKGPGLPRMVLIDLPGVINNETYGMASGTRQKIQAICRQYLENPSAIILCVQDGSVDAERNAVTDLVSQADVDGRRTIFVMTKADLAESTFANSNRVSQILSGRLFQLKALGYYAVVTGKGNSPASIQEIQQYEQEFFTNSKYFRQGTAKAGQLTTRNLAMAVQDCFWRMVKESSAQQSDDLKAMRYNLETEWKNSFGRFRQLERAELFDRARADILDELAALSMLPARHWHDVLAAQLWEKLSPFIVDHVLLPAAESNQFDTIVDVRLRQWADSGELPKQCVQAGMDTLKNAAKEALDPSRATDSIYAPVRSAIQCETLQKHNWDSKAEEALRIIQRTALDDTAVHNRNQWQSAVEALRNCVKAIEKEAAKKISELSGPSSWDQWMKWKSRPTDEQNDAKILTNELERMLIAVRDREWSGVSTRGREEPGLLTTDDLMAARRSAESQCGHAINNETYHQVWSNVRRRELAHRLLAEADLCERAFTLYQHERNAAAGGAPTLKAAAASADLDRSCSSVVLFHRLSRMLDATAMALRQQLSSAELRRLEIEAREDLEAIADDRKRLQELLSGRRVELAEQLKCVRHMQERLEEFLNALSQESAVNAANESLNRFTRNQEARS